MSTSGDAGRLPSIATTNISLQAIIDAATRLDELSTARVIGEAAEAVHKLQKNGQPLGTLTPKAIVVSSAGIKVDPPLAPSVAYGAPERLRGGTGDRRSDVFALGILLWEALAHARLFEGATDDARKQAVLEKDIPAPSELNANVPAELDAICKKALARDPSNRYQSTKVMAAEIATVLDDAGYPESNEQIAKYLEQTFPAGAAQAAGPGANLAAKLAAAPTSSAAPRAALNQTTLGLAPIKSISKPTEAKPADTRPADTAPPNPAEAVELTKKKERPASNTSPLGSSTSGDLLQPDAKSGPASAPKPNAPDAPSAAIPSILGAPPPNAPDAPGAAIPSILGAPPPAAAAEPMPSSTLKFGAAPAAPAAPVVAAPVTPSAPIVAAAEPAGKHGLPPPSGSRKPPASITTAETVATPALVPSKIAGLPAMPPGASESGSDDALTIPVTKQDPPAAEAPPAQAPPAPDVAAATSPEPPNAEAEPARPSQQAIRPSQKAIEAVSLPRRRADTSEMLGGWGWSTDSQPAVGDGDVAYEDDVDEAKQQRKRLIVAIGGALGVLAIILVIAIAMGGDDKKQEADPRTARGASPTAPDPATKPTPSEAPAPSADPNAGSAQIAPVDPGSGSAAPAVDPADAAAKEAAAKAEALAAENAATAKLAKEQAEQAKAAKLEEERLAKEQAASKAEEARLAKEQAAKDKAAKAEEARLAKEQAAKDKAEAAKAAKAAKEQAAKDKAEAARLAKASEAKKPEAKKPEAKKPEAKKPEPKTVAASGPVDPYAPDPATAYKLGFQQYVRGDTTGALATFKGSLANSPSYAPAWRGLGLVYEKMGQKAQAKGAFRRYLQLSPKASDAAQIRDRMEKL